MSSKHRPHCICILKCPCFGCSTACVTWGDIIDHDCGHGLGHWRYRLLEDVMLHQLASGRSMASFRNTRYFDMSVQVGYQLRQLFRNSTGSTWCYGEPVGRAASKGDTCGFQKFAAIPFQVLASLQALPLAFCIRDEICLGLFDLASSPTSSIYIYCAMYILSASFACPSDPRTVSACLVYCLISA